MKRVLPFVLCLILLCGCADDGKSQFLEFVNVVSSAENISFSAKVSAQYSDKTAQFTLGYEQTAEGASVSVIEPEMLRGIKANVAGKTSALSMTARYSISERSTMPSLAPCRRCRLSCRRCETAISK